VWYIILLKGSIWEILFIRISFLLSIIRYEIVFLDSVELSCIYGHADSALECESAICEENNTPTLIHACGLEGKHFATL
jgi:hypothetical protein